MRIAYLGQMADVSRETSIAKKILGQTLAWRGAGHEVRYFALAPSQKLWSELSPALPAVVLERGPLLTRHFRSRALCRSVEEWRPDLIYFRYAHHAAGLPRLFSRIPAVFEINSDDTAEYPLTLGPWKTLYHRFTRRAILSGAAGFVPVTHELASLVSPFGRPSRVIANSITLSSMSLLAPAPASLRPRLAFVGTARTPWHGLDRIAEMARMFPDWSFDIIGDDSSIWSSVSDTIAPANLTFHGTLERDRYLPVLASATIALGTFGLYRKNMHEACPLKVREYLALGLPVIGACADTDIPEGSDYYLRLPNDGSPLTPHRETIAAFVAHWQGRRVPRASVAHLDTSVKEAARLAFMAKIAADFRSASP